MLQVRIYLKMLKACTVPAMSGNQRMDGPSKKPAKNCHSNVPRNRSENYKTAQDCSIPLMLELTSESRFKTVKTNKNMSER
jgi:hypothetical protein